MSDATTRREIGIAAAGVVACALVTTAPIFLALHNWGIQDWDHHFVLMEVPRTSVLEYLQLPLWNPYAEGGMPMLAHPQSRFLTPFFLLHLIFGVVIAIKIEILLHAALLLLGSYLFARRFLQPVGATLAAAAFGLSTMFSWSVATGMSWFLAVAYLPWAFLLFTPKAGAPHRIGAAAILALMFGEGGAYVVAISGLGLTLWHLSGARRAELGRRALHLLEVAGFAVGFGAVKLLPALAFMWANPRPTNDYSGFSLASLAGGLLAPYPAPFIPGDPAAAPGLWSGTSYGVDENASYVGAVVVALFVVGLLLNGRRHWRLALGAAIFLWIAFGDRITPSLWGGLHLLPVFSTMRVAQRFRMVFLLFVAVVAGLGLQSISAVLATRLARWVRPRLVTIAAAGLVLAVIVELTLASLWAWGHAFPVPPVAPVRQGAFAQVSDLPSYSARGSQGFIDVDSTWGGAYAAVLANLGSTDEGYDSVRVTRGAVPRGAAAYRGEAYLLGAAGSAAIHRWSPNHLSVVVAATHPDLLVINQNYDAGWRASNGLDVVRHRDLLAVPVSPQDRAVELDYSPPEFYLGAWLTLATMALAVGLRLRRWGLASRSSG